MTNDRVPRFILKNGVPEIVYAFWSYSESPEIATLFKGNVLPFYGSADEKNKRDLWCHFRVRDLFILNTSLTTGEIPKEADEKGKARRILQAKKDPDTGKELPATQFIIDLFAFKTNDKIDIFTRELGNNLQIVKHRLTDFADITIDIAPLERVKFDDNYCGLFPEQVDPDKGKETDPRFILRVNGEDPLTRYIQLNIKRVLNSRDKPIWDISFKVELNERFQNFFIEKSDSNGSLFAWAWVLNWSTWKQYNEIFGIDITDKQQRISHLKNPQDLVTKNNYVPISRIPGFMAEPIQWLKKQETKLINVYNESSFAKDGKEFKGTILGEISYSRQEYQKLYESNESLPDSFPFDEPFGNFIAFRKELPVSQIYLGVDVGYPVGICEPEGKDLRWFQYYSSLNNENYGEHFAWMDKFLLKEGTADAWLKTIERDSIHNDNFSARCNKPIARIEFPFDTSVRVPFRCIDFMVARVSKKEEDIIKAGRTCPNPVDKVDYLWIIEDESIEGMELKSNGKEEKTDSAKLMLYKGFAVNDTRYRFIGISHNKVCIRGRDGVWQAHSVCQRPIYLIISVVRDFSEEEMQRYNANPMTVHFQVRDMKVGKTILFNKPLKLEYALKKGNHLFVMYPQFVGEFTAGYTNYSVTVSAPENLIPVQNNFTDNPDFSTTGAGIKTLFRVRNWERFLGFGVAQIKEHISFVPVTHGLFRDNPLVLIDDVRSVEAICDAKKKAYIDFQKDVMLGTGSFVASYALADDDMSEIFELFSKEGSVGKVSSGIKVTNALLSSNKILASEMFKRWMIRVGIKETFLDRIPIVGDFIEQMYNASKKFSSEIKRIVHPFMDTIDFGMSPDQLDSVYMIAATMIRRMIDTKTGRYTVIHDKNNVTGVMLLNRFIDVRKPFNYQMDKNSGFVERPVKFKNESDSVSIYRVDFQRNLENVRGCVRKVKADAGNNMGNYYDALIKGDALGQIFSKTECNFNPQFDFSADKEKVLLGKTFTCPDKMSKEEIIDSLSVLNFLRYIDASHPTCPKCGSIMKVSWGWCPYHGTRGKLKSIEDRENVDYKEEFIKQYKNRTVEFMQIENLLVHWTEFVV